MRKLAFVGAALISMISAPAMAIDGELEYLNLIAFQSVDANEDGTVSRREVDHFRELVMLSMDANGDEKVTLREYMEWDMGWIELARDRNKLAQYRKARADVFEFWDRNGDGNLSPSEQTLSQARDFYTASEGSNEPMDLETFSGRLRIMAAMNEAVMGGDEAVTLINVFTVPADKVDESVRFWDAAARFMRRQPGYISTALHRSISPDASFMLINVAKWESVDAFRSASQALRAQSGIEPVEGLTANPSLYDVIRSD